MTSWWVFALAAVGLGYASSFFSGAERRAGGGLKPWFQRWAGWKVLGRFLFAETKIVIEAPEELRACRQGILAAAPHGVVSFNHTLYMTDVAGWFADGVWPVDRRDLAASVVFQVPLYREFLLWLGNVDASGKVARQVLRSGRSLFVYPGGEAEQMRAEPGRHLAFWKTRKGFVRLAVEFGIPLVPSYAFGESEMYDPSSFLRARRLALCDKAHVAIPIAWGRRWCPMLPKKVPLVAVVGAPMLCPRIDPKDPTFEPTVDHLHADFCERLVALFDRHKAAYASADARLEIIGCAGPKRTKKPKAA